MIMKNYFMKSSMMLMAVSAALASCTQEDVLQNTPAQPSDNELKLSVSTQDFVSDAQGRAITNNDETRTSAFEDGDQMGLYIFSEDGEVLCDNLLYTYNGGNWTTDKTIYQYKNAQYVAYFPYCKDLSGVAVAENNPESDTEEGAEEGSTPSITESVTKNITAYFTDNILNTIPQTDAETYEQADLMVATAGQVEGTNVNLKLAHQFSMIELNIPCRKYITEADGFEYAAPVKKMKVEINEKTELYRAADGVYRMIVAPGTTPTIVGSVEYDENMPIYFSSESEGVTMKALAAGTFTQFNVTYDDLALKDLTKDKATGRYIRDLKPGDYYYSDGTIYPYDENKANQPFKEGCIGVIFEVGTGVPNTPWTHGSVLALKSLGQAKWSANRCTVEGNMIETLSDDVTVKSGYEVTQALVKTSEFLRNDAANLAYNLGKGEYDSQYAAPVYSSGWYLPSIADWVEVIQNLGGDTDFTLSTTGVSGDVISKIKNYIETIDSGLATDYFLKYTLSATEKNETDAWALELSGETFKFLNRQKVQNQTNASNKFGACAVLSF